MGHAACDAVSEEGSESQAAARYRMAHDGMADVSSGQPGADGPVKPLGLLSERPALALETQVDAKRAYLVDRRPPDCEVRSNRKGETI